MPNFRQGFFKPQNPEKYEGDPTKIVFRSSWEKRVMMWCDFQPSILSWSSEETVIPYFNVLDGKPHRYFVDFKIKMKTPNGVKTCLIEVKPRSQVEKPKEPKTAAGRKRYLAESETWIKNQQKWEAAREYCRQRGYEFVILDEYHLGLKKEGK